MREGGARLRQACESRAPPPGVARVASARDEEDGGAGKAGVAAGA